VLLDPAFIMSGLSEHAVAEAELLNDWLARPQ